MRTQIECEQFDDKSWVAYFSEEKQLIASGKTLREAVINLMSSLDDFLNEIPNYEPNLSNDINRQLIFISKILE